MKYIAIDLYYQKNINYLKYNIKTLNEDIRVFITLVKNRNKIDTKQFIEIIYDHIPASKLLEEDIDLEILYFCSDFLRFLNKEKSVDIFYYNAYKQYFNIPYSNISQETIKKLNDFILKYDDVDYVFVFAFLYFNLYMYVPFNKYIFRKDIYYNIYKDLNNKYNCGDKFKEEFNKCYNNAKEWYDNNIETEVDKLINLLIKRHNLEAYFN